MGLLNYLGGRGSSGYGEGSSRHVESDVGGVTVGGVALEEEKSWEQPDPMYITRFNVEERTRAV